MAKTKTTNTKRSSKKSSLRPSRLVKTGGKFSWGKIAIIAVSLVAIGSILASVSMAGFNTGTITANNPLTKYNTRWCAVWNNPYLGLHCDVPLGIAWWGPYLGYTINAPSGEWVTECALILNYHNPIIVRLDMTSDYGKIVWGSRDFYVHDLPNPTPYCNKFKIPQNGTLGGPLRLTNVEFRVWLLQGDTSRTWINSVSAHT